MRAPKHDQEIYGMVIVLVIFFTFVMTLTRPANAAMIEDEGRAVDPSYYTERSEPYEPVESYDLSSHTGCMKYAGLIAEYFPDHEVSKAISICQCESKGDPNAISDTNDHGLFQHNANSNPGQRFEGMGYTWADRYSPRANVAAAYWLWRETEGWGQWTCNRLTRSNEYSGKEMGQQLDAIAGPEGIETTVTPITIP